ncbi:hypothetical protein PWYN_28380 [Paenibacillus wynnii]|uniref:Uncharacterized protein n=1 Tax=Paenibacillus wynnii TaxID=268407 RepID=A0A098MA61_9BACL|nr:hypothetical protein PWYN_28380 [Paenibacillus wynnii]
MLKTINIETITLILVSSVLLIKTIAQIKIVSIVKDSVGIILERLFLLTGFLINVPINEPIQAPIKTGIINLTPL